MSPSGLPRSSLASWALMIAFAASAFWSTVVAADSVVPYIHHVRPTSGTIALIDPVTGTSAGGASGVIRYAVGDVLAFRIACTSPPNGALRGLGGYLTVYLPGNTEVVGARFTDAAGTSIPPDRGGIGAVGWGPRGAKGYALPLLEGTIAGLYGDTGIFFSTDPRTAQNPSAQEITLYNGILMNPAPTAANAIGTFLGSSSPLFYAHNAWDAVQVRAFGVSGGALGTGTGNTPFGYGSPVAGPQTLYAFEATETSPGVIQAVGNQGPWQRLACARGCEIGTGSSAAQGGAAGRVGVETSGGWALSPANPLPAGTNAVRFAVGELRTGEEEFAEISLRVLASPLNPAIGTDVLCAEVFGGDASSRREDGTDGGKDNPWRYYVASVACQSLGLQLELDVDRGLAIQGELIRFTLRARNLTLFTQTNVVLSQDLSTTAALAFSSATGSPALVSDVLTWPAMTLAPGASVTYTVSAVVLGNGTTTISSASYTSNQVPGPGRVVTRLTTTTPLAVPNLALATDPGSVDPGNTVTVRETITNSGTGTLGGTGCTGQSCAAIAGLPSGFTYVPGTTRIDGVATADPAVVGSRLRFTSGLPSIMAGQMATIEFDVAVPAQTAPGRYPHRLETWLKDVNSGRTLEDEVTDSIAVGIQNAVGELPDGLGSLHLDPVSPNPSRSTARVAFRLPAAMGVRVTIFDLGGRPVRTLAMGILDPGFHSVDWDGTSDAGVRVASGIYLVRLEAGKSAVTRKLLRMK